MFETLEREIAALPEMNLAELQAKWRSALKQAPPPHVRKQLLVPLLAYKLQEQTYGGLKPEVRRRLRELAVDFDRDPKKAASLLRAVDWENRRAARCAFVIRYLSNRRSTDVAIRFPNKVELQSSNR